MNICIAKIGRRRKEGKRKRNKKKCKDGILQILTWYKNRRLIRRKEHLN